MPFRGATTTIYFHLYAKATYGLQTANELIYLIAKNLSTADLNSFCQTCSLLYATLENQLFHRALEHRLRLGGSLTIGLNNISF